MTVEEFFNANGLSKIDMRESDSCYKDSNNEMTDVPIQYLRLEKPVEGFNFMTMSLNAVKACTEDPDAGMDLEVTLDEDYGWKIQVPDSSKKSSLKVNFFKKN